MRACRTLLPIATAAIALACGRPGAPPPGDAAPGGDPGFRATIAGRVTVEGPRPSPEFLRIDGDPNCVTANGSDRVPADFLVVGEGNALQNVFVYVKAGLEKHRFRVPAEPAVLDQQACRYLPRVVGVQVGQPLEVRNSDRLLHNVRAEGDINQPFNIGQPVQGTRFTRTFTTREVMIPFRCDVHAWMHAYVGVLEHPYFDVTDGEGRYTLKGLPPGDYTVEAWHERLGTSSRQVTVGPEDTIDVGFSFSR
jgi:hypothetical protein